MPQNLILASGNYEINSSTGELTGPGISVRGQIAGGKLTFNFALINIENGANIQVRGTTPVILQGSDVTINGKIISDGNGFPGDALRKYFEGADGFVKLKDGGPCKVGMMLG